MKNRSLYTFIFKALTLWLILSAVAMYFFKFTKNSKISFYSSELSHLEEIRTRVLLSTYFGIEKNYDRLAKTKIKLQDTQESLAKNINSIENEFLKTVLQKHLLLYCNHSDKRNELIDQFISLNAVFKNSQSYYPILSKNIVAHNRQLSSMTRLSFLANIADISKSVILKDFKNMDISITLSDDLKQVPLLKKHLKIVKNNGLKINEVLNKYPSIDVNTDLFKIKSEYDLAALKNERIQYSIKVSLILASICLIILASALLSKTLSYSKELANLNNDLEKKVKKRTEKLENMAQSLIIAKDEALASSRSKGRFLANMSHEIRIPMNGIIGFTNILAETPLTEEQAQHVETVQKSAESLLTIINDILDFSKIEEGKMELEEIPVNIHSILEHTMTFFSSIIRDKHELRLEAVNLDALKDKYYISDPSRIRQIIINLLSNAVKFTKSGTVKIIIEEHSKDAEYEKFTIHIEDTGQGISEKAQEKIFTPFSQEDASMSRKFGGTGLGLSISSQLAEMLGGQLRLKSQLHKGSTFSFDLQLKRDFKLFNESVDITKQLDWKEQPKILLVEDNKTNQKLTQILLKKEQLSAQLAENGLEALNMFKKAKFDLILMDCQMPEMDGFESTRHIRTYEKENSLGHIPIIALTANAMTGDREKCLKAGMDDFLSKPIDKEKLKRTLGQWLNSFLSQS